MNDAKPAGGLNQIEDNAEPAVSARKTADECTKISLRHIAAVHRIKTRIIGDSYMQLGEVVWQLLCAVRLSELHEAPFDLADFGKRFAMSDAILSRVVAYLENEGLLRYAECTNGRLARSLKLTGTGGAKVEEILEASARAFSGPFVYPKLAAVP